MNQMLIFLIVMLFQRNSATTMDFNQAEQLLSKYDALISAISAKSASETTTHFHQIPSSITTHFIPQTHITGHLLTRDGDKLKDIGFDAIVAEGTRVTSVAVKTLYETNLFIAPTVTVTVQAISEKTAASKAKKKRARKSRKRKIMKNDSSDAEEADYFAESEMKPNSKHLVKKHQRKSQEEDESGSELKSNSKYMVKIHQGESRDEKKTGTNSEIRKNEKAGKTKKGKRKGRSMDSSKHGLVVTTNEVVVVDSDEEEAEDLLVTESEIEVVEAINAENPRSKAERFRSKSKINRRAKRRRNKHEKGFDNSVGKRNRKKVKQDKVVKKENSSHGCLDQSTEYIGSQKGLVESSFESRHDKTNIFDTITHIAYTVTNIADAATKIITNAASKNIAEATTKIADVIKTAEPVPFTNKGACCMNYAETRTKTLTQVSVIPIHHTELRKQTNTIVIPKTIIVTNVKYEPYPVTKTEVDTMYIIKSTNPKMGCGCELGSNGMLLPGDQLPPGIFATPVNEVDRSKYDIIGYAGQKVLDNMQNNYNAPRSTL